ncbi:monosaccharide ABC transporter membrane protein (CUT2 family) [Asanoa ferruginea]|uniref:Monosaccharide ABC transporter membrane protein (CUT2 family) n=1 Tax=Asanoa ferruginea TaxID=53367 RepID=A0A3D9ZX28_9ACTN|nr:monosaccharide ABC transporter membrane protein (CUT2 family) [Asanoa ferruginea]GIF52038.1 sugar ABC transporter permease [Asanoa ferruginea]
MSDVSTKVPAVEFDGRLTKEQRRGRLKQLLSPKEFGGVYVWLLIIVVFAIAQPHTFPTGASVRTIANTYAISGIIALAVTIAMLCGLFDISVGYTMGLAACLSAWVMAHTSLPWWIAVLAGIGAGVVVGLVNAIAIVGFNLDPIIATLATGSIIAALTTAISGNLYIVDNVGGSFSENVARKSVFGFQEPFLVMLVLMLVFGFVLEWTKTGRFMYAIGFDRDTARLAGVRVQAIQTLTLVCTGGLAAVAGVMLTARIGAYSPGAGPPYLLPAFAGAFLGATMFRSGRFNVWGTIVATLLLGTGQFGILLLGGPIWSSDVFNGVALLFAMAVASFSPSAPARVRALSRLFGRRRPSPPVPSERLDPQ